MAHSRDEGLAAPPIPDASGMKNRIGRYAILKRLGAGGMANIFLGHSLGKNGFEKLVAIKRPHAVKRETTRMIINEARLVARLDHENICPILDFDTDNDGPYIVMPYLHGETMGSLIAHFAKTEDRPIDMFVHLAACVADGLNYAHDALDEDARPLGVIHRDVSPQNILVTFQGSTKILDFGVAKAIGFENGTLTGVLKGKYAYMSPEQVRGETLDRRSDIFSLGAVLWEALAGRRLFRRESDGMTIMAISEDTAPPVSSVNPKVPAELERIVARALERDRSRRWQTAAELAGALRSHLLDRRVVIGSAEVARWMTQTFPAQATMRSPLAAPTELAVRHSTPTATDRELYNLVFEHSTGRGGDSSPTLSDRDGLRVRKALESVLAGGPENEDTQTGLRVAGSDTVDDSADAPLVRGLSDSAIEDLDEGTESTVRHELADLAKAASDSLDAPTDTNHRVRLLDPSADTIDPATGAEVMQRLLDTATKAVDPAATKQRLPAIDPLHDTIDPATARKARRLTPLDADLETEETLTDTARARDDLEDTREDGAETDRPTLRRPAIQRPIVLLPPPPIMPVATSQVPGTAAPSLKMVRPVKPISNLLIGVLVVLAILLAGLAAAVVLGSTPIEIPVHTQ